MNRFTFTKARLTKDIELQTTTSGTNIATINVAVTRDRKNESGEYESDFFTLKAFKNTATTLNTYCHKGDMMNFEGNIRNNNYQDSTGKTRYSNEFIITNFEFVMKANGTKQEEKQQDPYEAMGEEIQESDLPFDFE